MVKIYSIGKCDGKFKQDMAIIKPLLILKVSSLLEF